MRKFALVLLLASSAVPTMANAQMKRGDDDSRPSQRSERAERAERSERPQRAERAERPERAERARPSGDSQRTMEMRREHAESRAQQQSDRPNANPDTRMRARAQAREQMRARRVETTEQTRQDWSDRRREVVGTNDTWQPRERTVRTIPNTQPTTTNDNVTTQHYDRNRDGRWNRDGDYRRGDRHRWAREWRGDRRYDWRRYRDRNRSTFRLGFYIDPFGWSYRRYNIGSYMNPYYYRSSYWLNDPWQYRLPPAYGPYRWVRYHNDALLIDTWNGEVVDVIYGFFW